MHSRSLGEASIGMCTSVYRAIHESLQNDEALTDSEIVRAINSFKDKEVTLDSTMEDLVKDGWISSYEQEQAFTYTILRELKMVCSIGPYAIVADGVHTKQRKKLVKLYCVHRVQLKVRFGMDHTDIRTPTGKPMYFDLGAKCALPKLCEDFKREKHLRDRDHVQGKTSKPAEAVKVTS
ncbi:hypothetical protein COOONC_07222 [Cooperia oncophora]